MAGHRQPRRCRTTYDRRYQWRVIPRTRCLVLAAALTAGALAAPASSAEPDPGLRSDGSSATAVAFGDGDRAGLLPAGEGRQVLQPLPRPDGTTPPVTVTSDGRATTVEAADSAAAPVLVDGARSPLATPAAGAAGAEDLVELRFEALGRDGRPSYAHINIFDVVTGEFSAYRRLPGDPSAECTSEQSSEAACILVPPGTYSLMALVATMPADKPSDQRELIIQNLALVGDAEVEVTEDRTVTFDARKARRVEVRTPGARTTTNTGGALELGYTRTAESGESIHVWQDPGIPLDQNFYLQPTAQVKSGDLETQTRLRLEAPDLELDAPRTPVLHAEYYDPVLFSDVSSQFPVYDGRARLRVVNGGHGTPADLRGKRLRGAIALIERSDRISVAALSANAAARGAGLVAIYNDSPGDNGDPGTTGRRLEVPTIRLSRADGRDLLDLGRHDRVTVRGRAATPYVYDLVLKEHGRIRPEPTYTARRGPHGNLAEQVRAFHGQPGRTASFNEAAYPWQPGDTFAHSTTFPVRGGPQVRSEYRLADPDTRWSFSTSLPETAYNVLFPQPPMLGMLLGDGEPRTLEAGRRTRDPVGAAPITAAPHPLVPFERSGDEMRITVAAFLDADGNSGNAHTDEESGMSTRLVVSANGEVLGETTSTPQGIATLPAGEVRMDIAYTGDNPQSWASLSSHVESSWSFTSAPVPAGEVEVQPVIVADYDVDVDLRNRTRDRTFRLRLAHLDGSDAPIDVTVQASYDGGATWRPATVRGARVTLPRGAGFVSLKVHAADDAGSVLDQTVIRAWHVR